MRTDTNWPEIVDALRQKLRQVETERDQARARVKGLEITTGGLKARIAQLELMVEPHQRTPDEHKTDRFGREEGTGDQ